jgi:DNA repair protein RadD
VFVSNLRGFQQELKNGAMTKFAEGMRAVMIQLSTGGGKTVIMGSFAKDHAAAPWDRSLPGGCAVAHRSELVSQISQQLAREEVPHDIIGQPAMIRSIVANHIDELGRTWYNARAAWRVASVDTLNKRKDLSHWAATVGMLFIDEAHHVLEGNKWGKAVDIFPDRARVLLPTATPIRADGRGLGRGEGGIADALVEGPPMRWLIDNGYLTDYKVFAIKPSDLNLDGVKLSDSGDFNPAQLRDAVHKSKAIVGDVVRTYCEHARGKLGVTFAVDISHAQEITDAFNAAGVPAALVTAESTDDERRIALRKFRNRELLQLVNVDLFGEGFDLPAIECVSFARPTASFALYSQQWGRALRLMISAILSGAWDTFSVEQRRDFIRTSGKPFAYIFDHAGNFYRHEGPPDKPRVWSLDARGRKRGPSDGIPMRTCLNLTCAYPYERIYPACPYCGTAAPEPTDRGGANTVDGDITEMDPLLLASYRGEINRIDGAPVVPYGVPRVPVIANHMNRQAAQHHLRETIVQWCMSRHEDARVAMRRFWFTFKIDVLAARTLNEKDADELRGRICADLAERGIVSVTNEMEMS